MSLSEPPLVSVIIAAFNAAAYISEAVYSVLGQSHARLEVIIVDDGSMDATAAIVRELACQDERVVLLTGHANEGVSAARNRGFASAKGEWVAILDADDLFHSRRIETLLAFAVAHGLDLAADNLEMHDFATGAQRGRAFPDIWMNPASDITMMEFLERDLPGIFAREIGFMKPIMRAEFLRRHGICYNASVWAGEDFLLYLDCLQHGARLRLLPDALYIYRLRAGSASSGQNANLELQRGNAFLLEKLGSSDPVIRDLLLLRQTLIRYELFNWRVKRRDMAAAVAMAAKLPPWLLCAKLAAALMRRIGVEVYNPSLRELQKLRERRNFSVNRAPAL